MLKKNDEFELSITDWSAEGGGVGKKDNIAVFVENTAVGDVVRCRVIKAKKTYAVGKVMELLKPSENRIEPACPAFRTCGGCSYCHIRYEEELRLKLSRVENAFLRIGHLSPDFEKITPSPAIERYRNKAQYPVRYENGVLKIGFFGKRSHRVTDAEGCLLQPPEFETITALFREWILENAVSVYNEETNEGLIRHLYLRKAFASGEVLVTVVANGKALPHQEALLQKLRPLPFFKSLVLNVNRERTNVILGDTCKTLYGPGFLNDTLCGVRLKLSPLSFYQVNHDAAELLYQKAALYAGLTGSETVLDLYCGTGTIGLSMAKNAGRLFGAEVVPDAVDDARENAKANGFNNAEFLCADAAEAAKELAERGIHTDVVLLDPPRKGCDSALIDTICFLAPERIVYVSCDPATLARDCALFSAAGYTVKTVAPFDLFPRTVHVETVVLLSMVKD